MQRLTKWGNSIGCRLPVSVLEVTGLKAGDYVQIRVRDDGTIQLRPKGKIFPAEPEDIGNAKPVQEEETVW